MKESLAIGDRQRHSGCFGLRHNAVSQPIDEVIGALEAKSFLLGDQWKRAHGKRKKNDTRRLHNFDSFRAGRFMASPAATKTTGTRTCALRDETRHGSP